MPDQTKADVQALSDALAILFPILAQSYHKGQEEFDRVDAIVGGLTRLKYRLEQEKGKGGRGS